MSGLVARARAVAREALAAGKLQPIHTRWETLPDQGIDFVLRTVEALRRKSEPKAGGNPFLPYDPGLFVADIGPQHVVLLNKFNVLEGHLLLVTRDFEAQDQVLNPADFEALRRALVEVDGLGFYNGGREAGASQAHKHLQLVPLPLAPHGPPLPIAPLLAGASGGRIGALPFVHAYAPLRWPASAEALCAIYRELLVRIGRPPDAQGQTGAYNLLLTRDWMLAVPRRAESEAGISVNALGFAGALLAPDAARARRIRRLGPAALLAAVSGD